MSETSLSVDVSLRTDHTSSHLQDWDNWGILGRQPTKFQRLLL